MNKKAIIILPILISLLMYIFILNRYSINIPLWDDYDTVLNFLNTYLAATSLKDKFLILFHQHNEHRIVISHILFLLYYKFFGQINFRTLVFICQISLIASIFPLVWIINKVNPNKILFNLVLSAVVLLWPNTSEGFIWVSNVSQTFQIMFSLYSMMFLLKYQDDRKLRSILLFIFFMILNALNSSGWLIMFSSVILYCLFRKEYILSIVNLVIFASISLVFFKILPYTFLTHTFTNIFQLLQFILGFTGSTFFSDNTSFFIGSILLLVMIFRIKEIINNRVYLLWFIFFYANALIIGYGRLGTGSVGLDFRFSIYSLVNMVFIVNLIFGSKLTYLKQVILLYIIIILSIISFKQQFHKGIQSRFDNCQHNIYYPDVDLAISIYNTSKELRIYNSDIIDEIIKNHH